MPTDLNIEPQPVPLTRLEDGTWRVSGTRIPLERVVEYYNAGETPEGIVDAFDTLRLADVYAVISFYLDHKEGVDEYMRACEREAEEVRKVIEAGQPWRAGLRERLLARQAELLKGADAANGR